MSYINGEVTLGSRLFSFVRSTVDAGFALRLQVMYLVFW